MITAGMVDRIIEGANFPYKRAVAANFEAVSPDIHSDFDLFRYK